MKNLADDTYSEFLKQNPVVLLDFWAPWCGPCKTISPILDKLEKSYAGQVAFAKVDTDDNQEVTKEFKVTAMPTLVLISGETHMRLVGAHPEAKINEFIKSFLNKISNP